MIKRKWEAGNIRQKREVFDQNGRVGTQSAVYGTILVITLLKLYQQHSERLSLRSSETKSHRHLHIESINLPS